MEVDSTSATIALLVGSLLLFLFISLAEGALRTVSRAHLRELQEAGRDGADAALSLLDSPQRLQESIWLLRLLLALWLAAAVEMVTLPLAPPLAVVAGGVWLLLVPLHALARGVGQRAYNVLAPRLAPLLNLLVFLVTPLRKLLAALQATLAGTTARAEEERRAEEEERRVLASVVGEEESDLPQERLEMREMLYSLVSLAQTTVREVMVPRPDLITLRSDATMDEALDLIIREGHSRIPIYEESIDNVVGILYAKDLFGYLRDGRTELAIRDMARPAYFVPSSKMADELLEELQRRRVHLAIVFDEYGGTAGLVTIEDILEEIVGEIQDEYDEEEAAFHRISEYEATVSGRFDIDDLNHEMALNLPTDENDTVGGLIYSALGRVPLLRDSVRMEESGVTFRVIAMAGRRILKVRVEVDRPTLPDISPGNSASEPAPSPDNPPARRNGAAETFSRLSLW